MLIIGLWLFNASALALAQPSVVLAGLMILVCTVLTFALAMSIVRPVTALHVVLSQIKAGDHTATVPHQNLDDEIGAVARALEEFKLRIHALGQRNVADRLQYEEERIRVIEELTTAYQSSLAQIVDDVTTMADKMAREIAKEYESAADSETKPTTLH